MNKLKLRNDTRLLLSVLNQIRSRQKMLLAWKLFGRSKLSAELRIIKIGKSGEDFVVRCSDSERPKLMQIISGEEKLNLFIPSEGILLQVQIKCYHSDDSILLSLPTQFAQVERRNHLRVQLDETKALKIAFKKGTNTLYNSRKIHFNKSCYDLSSGGLSLFLNKNEIKYFIIGEGLECIEIFIGSRTLKVQGKIAYIVQIDPNEINHLFYKGWKVGIRFENLNEKDRDIIHAFVFEHLKWDGKKGLIGISPVSKLKERD